MKRWTWIPVHPAPALSGPTIAAKAPPGSFARSGHDAPHAHMIETDPSGEFAIATDLGLDIVIVWKFDRNNGTLRNPRTFPTSSAPVRATLRSIPTVYGSTC